MTEDAVIFCGFLIIAAFLLGTRFGYKIKEWEDESTETWGKMHDDISDSERTKNKH